jgi:hypothetical protein
MLSPNFLVVEKVIKLRIRPECGSFEYIPITTIAYIPYLSLLALKLFSVQYREIFSWHLI